MTNTEPNKILPENVNLYTIPVSNVFYNIGDITIYHNLVHKIEMKAPDKLNSNHKELLQLSLYLAYTFHEGQKRRSGVPYIFHPISVAYKSIEHTRNINTDNLVLLACISLLHDTLEDTNLTSKALIQAFWYKKEAYAITTAVEWLTRADNKTALDTIITACDLLYPYLGSLVIATKLADRIDNLLTLDYSSDNPKYLRKLIESKKMLVKVQMLRTDKFNDFLRYLNRIIESMAVSLPIQDQLRLKAMNYMEI